MTELSCKAILAASGVAFGTSGARGLVTDLTPAVCAAFTQSVVQAIATAGEVSAVALGINNRSSGNAPELRCYTESHNQTHALLLLHTCLDAARS